MPARRAQVRLHGSPEELALIGAALGGARDDNVLDLLAAGGERIVPNVKFWLDALGVPYQFWNRIETDHG